MTEAHQEVKATERSNLIDEEWIGDDYFEEQLARGSAAFEKARQLYLEYNAKTATDDLQKLPWLNQTRRGPNTS